jgi:hypothetical protein
VPFQAGRVEGVSTQREGGGMSLNSTDLMMAAQAARVISKDLFDESVRADNQITKQMFGESANKWLRLAERIDQAVEQQLEIEDPITG